jgi:hypothetical protein
MLSGLFYTLFLDQVNDFFSVDDNGLALPYLLVLSSCVTLQVI